MRHPFDGINQTAEGEQSSRREALQWIAGASASASLLASTSIAAAEEASVADGYALYFVVPKKFKSFSTRRRADLGVQGTYLSGLSNNKALKESKGFLAWLTEEQSKSVASAGDVKACHAIQPADFAVQGAPPEKGPATLRIHAAPFQWSAKLPANSYLTIEQLGDLWSKQFSMHEGVKVVANKAVRTPFITTKDGSIADTIVKIVKEQPQVYALEWLTPVGPTTLRLGEEGGATTRAVGEEGGVTTKARFEEGGVTTDALGEEGGVTTQALGEEGGRPRPSTRALGEEGGVRPRPQPTTLAIGEEGGRGKAPAILPKEPPQKFSTQALGEEGGRGLQKDATR